MRLIDADALIEDIKSFWDWDSIDGITATTVLKQTMTDISNATTIDAEPVRHGRWLHPKEDDEDYHTVACSCSVCGWKFNLYEDDIDGAPYCAVCGAKMEPVSSLYQVEGASEEGPTAEAVPVVRCKDCAYYEPDENGGNYGGCSFTYSLMPKDGYCSDGRKLKEVLR